MSLLRVLKFRVCPPSTRPSILHCKEWSSKLSLGVSERRGVSVETFEVGGEDFDRTHGDTGGGKRRR